MRSLRSDDRISRCKFLFIILKRETDHLRSFQGIQNSSDFVRGVILIVFFFFLSLFLSELIAISHENWRQWPLRRHVWWAGDAKWLFPSFWASQTTGHCSIESNTFCRENDVALQLSNNPEWASRITDTCRITGGFTKIAWALKQCQLATVSIDLDRFSKRIVT